MIILLLLFWMVLSGQISLFFIVSAILSVVFAMLIDKKIFYISPLVIGIKWSWIVFVGKLLREMFLSSLSIIKIVWFSVQKVQPCCIDIEVESEDKLNQVVQANSITLTPGTMTLQLQDNKILVHAINAEMMQDLQKNKANDTGQNI